MQSDSLTTVLFSVVVSLNNLFKLSQLKQILLPESNKSGEDCKVIAQIDSKSSSVKDELFAVVCVLIDESSLISSVGLIEFVSST